MCNDRAWMIVIWAGIATTRTAAEDWESKRIDTYIENLPEHPSQASVPIIVRVKKLITNFLSDHFVKEPSPRNR